MIGNVEALVVAVVAGLIVLGIGSVIGFLVRPSLQARQEDRQEERLLRAFLKIATEANPHQKLMVPVYVPKAADLLANIRDPDPVLARLVRKKHIRQFPKPNQDYHNLTFEGRQRAYDLRPSFWQLLSGK